MDPIEREVLAANEAFYRAFRERNLTAMAALWAKGAPVACMHPGMTALTGREAVLRSFRGIMAHPDAPTLHCSGAKAHVLGTSAYVTCLEGGERQEPRLVSTNVFTLEDGRWRLVHHQSGPLSPQTARRSSPPPRREPGDPHRLN
jgi:ketosteroid isomerase-like protein